MPTDALPSSGNLEIPYLDKYVHIIFFGAFVGLWCYYFSTKQFSHRLLKIIFFSVYLFAVVNGIAIEYIQLYFIPNRSFDQGDIIADIISAGMGYGICNVKLLTCRGKSSTSSYAEAPADKSSSR